MRIEEILREINIIHHTTFELIERYTDGEQGAFAIADTTGTRFVLKRFPGVHDLTKLHYARTVTDTLRARGYPAPEYRLFGLLSAGAYCVQTRLPGSPLYHLTTRYLPHVLALLDCQREQAPVGARDMRQEVIRTVLEGGEGYCMHASLQQHSSESIALLRRLQTIVEAYGHELPARNDIVHFDFQPFNLLVEDQEISGVIDWEDSYGGDCTFDLATMLFYAYDDGNELCESLWEYGLAHASRNVLSVYLAHLILRQVDWSLRYRDRTTGKLHLARGLAILTDIAGR
jgi:hypothetical protein